jgi:surface antigen/LysM repeat protein
MKIKAVLVTLSVMATVMLGNSATVNAESTQTETKTDVPAKVVINVKAGDTLDAIATANNTTYIRLFNANESIAHPDRIDVGDEIRIPTGDEQLPDRFAQLAAAAAPVAVAAPVAASVAAPATAKCDDATQWVRADNGQCIDKPGAYRQVAATAPARQAAVPAPAVSVAASGVPAGSFGTYNMGNGWWCTDYVKSKRPDVPIYGNAGMYWISADQAQGKATGTTPRAGAVAVMAGHVAYVESVNANGTYVVSEMGWMYQAGQFNRRTVSPGAFGGFIY